MDFKYYHGTSSIFLDSIRETGLGGINPNIDFRNLDLLRFLNNDAERYLLDNEDYSKIRNSVNAMAKQTDLVLKTDSGDDLYFNYRHDSIYVSLTRERAVIYACINNYGSEILQYSIDMYLKLKNKFENYELPDDLNLFKIERFINKEHKRILIEIKNIKDSDIETEYGDDSKTVLDKLRIDIHRMSPKEKFELLQYVNFKLLRPVLLEDMTLYEIDYESHPKYRNFEWTLTKI